MISLPKKPKIVKKENFKAVFEIEGLYPGYGVTIGNSLRRVLLSSLEGAAITEVKIKGVPHEFSTMKGVLEDTILILLNLKKVRFKMYTDEPQIGKLSIKGEKVVRAGDFKLPPQVEIVNKDLYIATLTDEKSSLEMEIQIEKGIGYEPAERRKKEKLEIGSISLDAIYTPIKNVAFRVENMRVGERTDYDRLMLEIETDGTILPEEAFLKANEILVSHFTFLSQALKKEVKTETKKRETKKTKIEKEKPQDFSKIKIEDWNLSARTKNILLENGVKSIAGLIKKGEKDILAFKGMGDKGLKEIKKSLKKLNLSLKQ